jgi:transposase
LAHALEGMDRGEAARLAGMDRQTLRDWVIRFNAEGVKGLCDRAKSGRPTWLDEGQLATLKALVLRGPDPERDGVSAWRAKDLCRAPGSQDRRWWSVRSGASRATPRPTSRRRYGVAASGIG